MHWRLSFTLCLGISLVTVATADNSVPSVSTAPVVPLVVSTSSVSNVAVSSVTAPVDHVENVTLRRFVGNILTIDPAAYKLALQDHDGKPSEFILTQRTRVTTDDGHRVNVSVLKSGDRVMIRYVENYNYVRKIDILPAASQ